MEVQGGGTLTGLRNENIGGRGSWDCEGVRTVVTSRGKGKRPRPSGRTMQGNVEVYDRET